MQGLVSVCINDALRSPLLLYIHSADDEGSERKLLHISYVCM